MIDKNTDIPLENPQWENFARLYFEGKTAEDSYTLAGFKSKYPRKNAPRLLKKSEIIARIRHFKTEAAIKAGITQEKQAQKLEDVILRSRENGDRTNEVAAIREQNKLYGLSADKIIHEKPQDEFTEERLKQAKEAAKQSAQQLKIKLINSA